MTQWVKWPHCNTDWHPQNVESPQRIMRTSENSHSHSWWWDSHISPNYSRWLVENLRGCAKQNLVGSLTKQNEPNELIGGFSSLLVTIFFNTKKYG
eukprot:c43150_g1_i1 orf=175-462(-)